MLGNYSGRNAGDAAILAGLMHEISSKYPDVHYIVPSLKPDFINRTYGQYSVEPVDIMPWRGCIKLLGWPVWRAIKRSDLVLVTDAILFDRGLYNPMHNYLSTLALLVPAAKKRNIPVVLYNSSLGPADSKLGKWCLRRVLNNAEKIILRDEESKKLDLIDDDIAAKFLVGADSALSADVSDEQHIKQLLAEVKVDPAAKPMIGINVNSYGDAFIQDDGTAFSLDKFLSVMAQAIKWIHEQYDVQLLLFGTQHMDLNTLGKLREKIDLPGVNIPVFTNRKHSYAELTGLFKKLDMLIGMRTHSTILSTSVATPVIGIVTYPKTFGYLERVGQAQNTIPLKRLTLDNLKEKIAEVWSNRESISMDIATSIAGQKQLALGAADYLTEYLS